ncbi:hypothetical protein B0H19DRAFT_1248388 [Mycena capillaripes]|nr:hypothetical protein B0H19DRAFT_1248388 [Mycena capillaripes]
MARPAPLPHFGYVGSYEQTRNEIIEATIPNDDWLRNVPTSKPTDAEPDDAPADTVDDDVSDDPAEIRYIDLSSYKDFVDEFNLLGTEEAAHPGTATFVIRHEYRLFIEQAVAASFVVALRLLDSDIPVLPKINRTLRESWLLIDLDDDTMPKSIFNQCPFGIWRSSPHIPRLKYFRKHFKSVEYWFMKPWSTKEITAAADRLGSAHDDVTARMVWCGPVARHLFRDDPPTKQEVSTNIVLAGNPFDLDGTQPDSDGTQPVYSIFLVTLIVVVVDGVRQFKRDEFFEFLAPAVAAKTLELAETRLDASTRGVAGKLVEGLMHRALMRGIRLPAVFGGGAGAATPELVGKSDVFTHSGDLNAQRPLYLRPLLSSFAAVDAMVATTPKRLGMLQTSLSLSDTHTRNFGAMLHTIARLPVGAGVQVEHLEEIIYCVVGSDPIRVQTLVHQANVALTWLKELAPKDTNKFREETGVSMQVGRTRIGLFRVVGLVFDCKAGLRELGKDDV